MDRSILFRGRVKLPDHYRGRSLPRCDGDWVYGLMDSNVSIGGVFVDAKTIGQCTGLNDKNGVDIFEGDVVRIGRWFSKYFYGEDNYVCRYDANSASFKFYYIMPKDIEDISCAILGDGVALSDMKCDFTIKVIGNIWDNPELIESEDMEE